MMRFGPPHVIVTDLLQSYGAAMKVIGNAERQETGRWLNNRAENSHLPFRQREWAMLRFRRTRTLQKFVAVHSSVHNHFNQERHLYARCNFKFNRAAALDEWRQLGTAKRAASLSLQRLVRIRLTAPLRKTGDLETLGKGTERFDISLDASRSSRSLGASRLTFECEPPVLR